MKIAVAAPSHLPARRANTIQVMKMCAALSALGHEARLVVPELPPQTVSWAQLLSQYGLSTQFLVEWLPARPALRRWDYGWGAVSWARRWGAELFYTRLPQAAALSARLGLPTIFEVHDMPQGWSAPLLLRLFLSGRGAQRLVVITHALARDLSARFNLPAASGRLVVAPDGVDLERFEGLPQPEEARALLQSGSLPSIRPEAFTAGYTGSLYPGRGTELLFELAARLPDIQFLFAGGEPAAVTALRQQAAQRSLQNLHLPGFVPNQDLPHFQAACDLLLMPYQQHVAASSGGDIARYLSPMKMFEYLACGRPLLASDLPVLQEVLNEQNAMLLPGGDIEVWVQSVQRLRNDPALCAALGQRARQDALQYSWTARARRILDGLVK